MASFADMLFDCDLGIKGLDDLPAAHDGMSLGGMFKDVMFQDSGLDTPSDSDDDVLTTSHIKIESDSLLSSPSPSPSSEDHLMCPPSSQSLHLLPEGLSMADTHRLEAMHPPALTSVHPMTSENMHPQGGPPAKRAKVTSSSATNKNVAPLPSPKPKQLDSKPFTQPDACVTVEQFLQTLSPEERAMMEADGITLPREGILSKAQERELKRLRRKIKNKLSAKDSRRRRKEYITQLEAENRGLRAEIDRLRNSNQSLNAQCTQLLNIIKPAKKKAGKACVMMFLMLALSSANCAADQASLSAGQAIASKTTLASTGDAQFQPLDDNEKQSILSSFDTSKLFEKFGFSGPTKRSSVQVDGFVACEGAPSAVTSADDCLPDLIPASLLAMYHDPGPDKAVSANALIASPEDQSNVPGVRSGKTKAFTAASS